MVWQDPDEFPRIIAVSFALLVLMFTTVGMLGYVACGADALLADEKANVLITLQHAGALPWADAASRVLQR